jgi:hypothetical protein
MSDVAPLESIVPVGNIQQLFDDKAADERNGRTPQARGEQRRQQATHRCDISREGISSIVSVTVGHTSLVKRVLSFTVHHLTSLFAEGRKKLQAATSCRRLADELRGQLLTPRRGRASSARNRSACADGC